METQRNDIGDRAAPPEAPESTPAPDPSVHQDDAPMGGEVEQPGEEAACPGTLGAAGQVRSQVTSDTSDKAQKPSLKKRAPASITPIGPLEQKQAEVRRLTRDVAEGVIRGAMLVGPPGLGKTEVPTTTLAAMPRIKCTRLVGHATPLKLYLKLYNHCTKDDVVVVEDMRWDDPDAVNILLAALSGPKDPRTHHMTREVIWETSFKLPEGTKDRFVFEGGIIFASNRFPSSDTWGALRDRCMKVDFRSIKSADVIAFMRERTRNGTSIEVAGRVVHFTKAECAAVIDVLEKHHVMSLRKLYEIGLPMYHAHQAHDAWQPMLESDLLSDHAAEAAVSSEEQIVIDLERTATTVGERVDEFHRLTGADAARSRTAARRQYFRVKAKVDSRMPPPSGGEKPAAGKGQ